MRTVFLFTLLLVVNSLFPGKINVYLADPTAFISFIFIILYASYNDQKERDFWAALVKLQKHVEK